MSFPLPQIDSTILDQLDSPSLLIVADQVRRNIDQMIRTAGSVDRLRPHCKTHKMAEVIRLLLEQGIQRHKAATIAECEMLANAGATDIVFAYNPVGPNIGRVIRFVQQFPNIQFTVTADHRKPLQQLSDAAQSAGVSVGVMLDVDVGLHRTGVRADSPAAAELYQQTHESPGVTPAGFHVYDGHNHQDALEDRTKAVMDEWPPVLHLRDHCVANGWAVPEILCGGTPTFPVYAKLEDPAVMLSPGTSIFHDAGYGGHFPDLGFQPAALLVTRVISRPTADRLTLDLGNKAVAADPPKGHRVYFADLPDAAQVVHNEEHLVLETPLAENYQPGDVLLGIPMHVCPTSALHQSVTVVDDGKLIGQWDVTARNRRLTI